MIQSKIRASATIITTKRHHVFHQLWTRVWTRAQPCSERSAYHQQLTQTEHTGFGLLISLNKSLCLQQFSFSTTRIPALITTEPALQLLSTVSTARRHRPHSHLQREGHRMMTLALSDLSYAILSQSLLVSPKCGDTPKLYVGGIQQCWYH